MDKSKSLKRRMLREAIRDNVDVIKGRYRFKRPPKISQLRSLATIFFFIAVPLALLLSSYLIANVAGEWLDQRAAERLRSEEAAAAEAETTSGLAGLSERSLALLSDEQLLSWNRRRRSIGRHSLWRCGG